MKRTLMVAGLLAVLCSGSVFTHSTAAFAGNSAVEANLRNYGDVSMFYQALINTGVLNELSETKHYTIFAPTNLAFGEISHQKYPCFYSEYCRPQIAALLRNHIVEGSYSLSEATKYGQGLQTMGNRRLVVTQEYVNHYAVNNQDILSNGDTGSNVIYRVNGVISDPQEMAQFQNVNIVPAAVPMPEPAMTTTQRTITQRTYLVPSPTSSSYPAGPMDPYPIDPQVNMTETTTIINRYSLEQ